MPTFEEDLIVNGRVRHLEVEPDTPLLYVLRNDLGRTCRGGTVKVVRHKTLEAYMNAP